MRRNISVLYNQTILGDILRVGDLELCVVELLLVLLLLLLCRLRSTKMNLTNMSFYGLALGFLMVAVSPGTLEDNPNTFSLKKNKINSKSISCNTVKPLITNTPEEFIKCRLDNFSMSFLLYYVNFSICENK